MAAVAGIEHQADIQNLDFHEELGSGAFGSVSRVTFKTPYKGYKEAAAKSIVHFRPEEVEIMIRLSHPHIVKLLGFYKNGPISIILLEYAPNGSLRDFLKTYQANNVPHSLIRKWAKESALAIDYLHQNKIIHRDIKVHNCLLFQDNCLKLCDFGLAKELDYSQSTSSQKGTFRYMAPEILRGNELGRSVYSRRTDIYAYGMLLLEIITKKPPFDKMEYGYVVFHVGNGQLLPQPPTPVECPQELVPLVRRCWAFDPMRRPSIQDFIRVLSAHPCPDARKGELTKKNRKRPWRYKIIYPHIAGVPIRAGRIACCPNGDLVVADLKNVYILDKDGKSKRALCSQLKSSFTGYVESIAISSQGLILVLVNHNRVMVFDAKGTYLRILELPYFSSKIATDMEGNILLDCKGKHTVITLSCPQGKMLQRVKNSTIVHGGSMVENNKSQVLLHTDDESHFAYTKVTAIDYYGREKFAFIPIVEGRTSDVLPGGIASDAENNIYIALRIPSQEKNGHIHKYDDKGAFVECIAKGLYEPSDLVIMPNGSSLAVANINSVLIYSKA